MCAAAAIAAAAAATAAVTALCRLALQPGCLRQDPDFYEDEELYDDLDLCGVEVNMDLGVNEKDASDSRRESQQAESSKETAKQKV
eukprot:COSAG01_NODE_4793_length_4740_cov_3.755441_2_plen_86_part_00